MLPWLESDADTLVVGEGYGWGAEVGRYTRNNQPCRGRGINQALSTVGGCGCSHVRIQASPLSWLGKYGWGSVGGGVETSDRQPRLVRVDHEAHASLTELRSSADYPSESEEMTRSI